MSFFKVKNENGNWVPPETEEMIDQTYNSKSKNAQSGVAVAQAVAQGLGIVETELSNFFELKE